MSEKSTYSSGPTCQGVDLSPRSAHLAIGGSPVL